ncbi:MAG: polymer-forming cytoskeletal protein [Longicatena sp.]
MYNVENETYGVDEVKVDTVFSTSTVLTGDLKVQGNLVMSGKIVGNVECSGDLKIDGSVEGNIKCSNARLDHATIKGNIQCSGNLEVVNETNIEGDIVSNDIINNGKIIGNLKISNEVCLSKNAVVEGNIEAQSLESEKGAILKGQIFITSSGSK